MKLIEHVLHIRSLIQQAIDNRFSRLGLEASEVKELPENALSSNKEKRSRLESIIETHKQALGDDYAEARKETINECTFTLFNRLAALKVMEDRELFPEVIRCRVEHGNLSYAHKQWLEEHADERNAERMGLKHFLEDKFQELSDNYKIPLYSPDYAYAMLPTADELFEIITAFNKIEQDEDCGADIWKGDDILGWMYENFNTVEKLALKDSGEKTEYDKVSLQSQVYTPQWVVKFLVDNTLGKMYLEMYPDSNFIYNEEGKVKYLIANAPSSQMRHPKKLEEIKLIDPACGSGNFLIYAFSLFYDLYLNQIDQYDAGYSRRDIPKLIVENNLYGVDLDERAVQLTQIALFIKAMQLKGRRGAMPAYTHVVSTHFELPEYNQVEAAFMSGSDWNEAQQKTIRSIWEDLRAAYKFGSLIRVEEQLDALLPVDSTDMFANQWKADMFDFKHQMITTLRNQVHQWTGEGSNEYSLAKANDAITFLDILSMKFDVAVANPPYTDSADFGAELKEFVGANYSKPLKFNSNLYACFIKRCCELAGDDGKVGMIHPLSFMYISSYEQVRKYILNNTHISILAELGLGGVFKNAQIDTTAYILDKSNDISGNGIYINLTKYKNHANKPQIFVDTYKNCAQDLDDPHVYRLSQTKFKQIKSYPFIYWISDEFREKFGKMSLANIVDTKKGLDTTNNERFLRFFWEVNIKDISNNYVLDKCKWVRYAKGGPYNKWYGNLWLVINWADDGYDLKHFIDEKGKVKPNLRNMENYFQEGLTYSAAGSKGITFRYLPKNMIFDSGGPGIFFNEFKDKYYVLALLNSVFTTYVCNCLNPTVNTTHNDLRRIPFALADKMLENKISSYAKQCVLIKQYFCRFSIIEITYTYSPITSLTLPKEELVNYFDYENGFMSLILLNESIINRILFDVYELSVHDRQMVLDKEGIPVGDYSVSSQAKKAYKEWLSTNTEFSASPEVWEHIDSLEINEEQPHIDDFESLYQNNNGWEEFCIKHKMNPIEVWYQFKNAGILPPQRTQVLAFELITDVIRSVLAKDDDGVIPLTERMGEEQLAGRIEQELVERGYNSAQISQIIQILGGTLNDYLLNKFFSQLSNHLKLFKHLPATPFIWHLTSGPHHAIDLYISIYKWSRDTVFRIKSVYIANRETALNDRLSGIDVSTANGQLEAAELKEQLKELKAFAEKIDELLASGYNPKLDDGVGKNIAPLQKAGLLSYEVLNAGQLKKYLNADW
ncbi:BREX-1 system adenine-specific DNA-methyltransferase PglX [Phocaeicola salanitronis]|uniref:BREX-1 system adenine-specific DNA-methyltransferase PglX n=1 Tax=Phocaeicola salanitronis TaxID=376805 RepID=UPI0023F87ED6|nr:BREX-1 system adenine-specific DNA-methyltransferase PglX [Phocaeicola salanitronis]